MAAPHHNISFQKLCIEISHNREISGYIDGSLSKLEGKLRGFTDGPEPMPSGIRESICRDLSHISTCAGHLFESLEAIIACLCREHPEPDIVGHDLAEQVVHNDRGQP
jgi:hypothetical protein